MAIKAKRKGKKSKKQTAPKLSSSDKALRQQLKELLTWAGAHVDWQSSVADVPVEKRGQKAAGLAHSPWELLEHTRIAQRDILEFCIDAKYKSREWPGDYWPKTPAPAEGAWEEAVESFFADTRAVAKLIEDPRTDLFAKIPHGTGQTILREAVLLADHNAYHLGQFVLVLRALGAWKET